MSYDVSIHGPLDTAIWEPDPDPERKGYLRKVRDKTVREVYDEILAVTFEDERPDEYFTLMEDGPWPAGRIVVFSVNGTSEGDYVHIEVHAGGERHLLILGKTFQGRDEAWKQARRLADLLGA